MVEAAPSNSDPPSISGTAQEGQALTSSSGTWTGHPTSFAYRWRDCDASGANCLDIAGATEATYVLQASDVGSTLRVVVTATNCGWFDGGDLAADRSGGGLATVEHGVAVDLGNAAAGSDRYGLERRLDGESDLVHVSLARL